MSTTDLGSRLARMLAATVATGCLLAAAACGGSQGDDGTLPSAGGSTASSAADEEPIDPDEAMLRFTECMREQGIDMGDPDDNGALIIGPGDNDPEQMEAAEKVCGRYLEAAMPDDTAMQIPEEDKQKMLDLAACMRDRGYDFPDPTFDGGQVSQELGENTPAFQKDHEECAAEVGMGDGFMEAPQ